MSLIARIRALQAAGQPVTPEALQEPDDQVDHDADAIDADSMISPARRHRLLVLGRSASQEGGQGGLMSEIDAGGDLSPADREIMQLKVMLLDHQQTLKATKSLETKIELKRQFAPLYADWIDGVLQIGVAPTREQAAELIATMMTWRIDIGDYEGALPLVEFVLRHNLSMPARFDRDVATFVTDQVSEAAILAYDRAEVGVEAFPLKILAEVEDLVAGIDMHDEVKAKLQKAIGRALASDAGDESRVRQEEALKRYLRALELNPNAGVKKDVERLQSALKKSAPNT